MKVITLLNEKGGVGKTTLSTHIAAGLAIQGKRVLLIDTDAQANSTTSLRVPESAGLYRLLVQDAEWREVLVVPERAAWTAQEPKGSLWLLPSNIETRAIPMVVDDVRILIERLDEISAQLDYVVIDTSPTPSLLHSMIYLASDYMVYPTQSEILSMYGLAKSVSHMKRSKETRKVFGLSETCLIGVQPMMFQGNTLAHQHGLQMIQEQFKQLVWEPIPARTIYREASFAQQTLFAYAPGNPATNELWGMVERVKRGIA